MLLADQPVLVLDEPTEGLDEETAEAVVRDLLQASPHRTVVLLTHRTEGLDLVDEAELRWDGCTACADGGPTLTSAGAGALAVDLASAGLVAAASCWTSPAREGTPWLEPATT